MPAVRLLPCASPRACMSRRIASLPGRAGVARTAQSRDTGAMAGTTLRHFLNAVERGDIEEAAQIYHHLGGAAQDIARPHLARLRGEERSTRKWLDQASLRRRAGHNGTTKTALMARGKR